MEKFYLGMDIGSDSVGMACTDEHYNLLRAKGKDLWSVRLFDEANAADERRIKRTSRRRLQRRRQRIEWLQEIFAPFMLDKLFFIRLNNSGFYEEDKKDNEGKLLNTKFSLFSDERYTDKDFYADYPTVFHLREALIKGQDEKLDIRHYYLALHHIIKYRGHFLYEGETIGELRDMCKLFEAYNDYVSEAGLDLDVYFDPNFADSFKEISLSRKGLNDKKKESVALFNATSIENKEWITLILGGSASPKKLFGEEYAERYKEEKSIAFKGLSDENFEALSESFEEQHFDLLRLARNIFNFTLFEKVLEGHKWISESMVCLYEKHKADLKLLKDFVKKNYPSSVYHLIFRSQKETANYANYVGYTQTKGEKIRVAKCKDTREFYKFLKKTLGNNASDKETLDYILKEIENESFLPKIVKADNGLFPHQINEMELDAILDNLCKRYPNFLDKDETVFSPQEKIKKLFKFKIPYYVGPLGVRGDNVWMVRKSGKTQKITPWNFDEVVDKASSNEGFIRRMTNKCAYMRGKDIIPKRSMYYQAFDVLNQINKLTIGGAPISISLKQEIFNNLYLCNKKVGAKQIREYLARRGYCTIEESKNVLGGFDNLTDLKASMSSYVTFKTKFGSLVDEKPDIFENIIFWHTLNTDKSLVEQMIRDAYGDIPEIIENVKWIKGLTSFTDFGRLSKALLCEIIGGVDVVTGEAYTILNRLYNTNDNFNQLLFSDEYNFKKAIEENNFGTAKEEITYDDVKELYLSPMARRGVWQALTMADEYVKNVGKTPDKIFIEVTRQDGEKGDIGRTASRKQKLLELYKGISSDCREIEELIKELNRDDITESKLRSERLYLYFLQLGKCAYTGNRIDLEDLVGSRYDVDHIIPQSMTKDDSIDNKVLVETQKNHEKTNVYPLPSGFSTQRDFWKILKEKKLMSQEKYNRLTRTEPLTEADFRNFINRQLVVTNQTVKVVAELLKEKYEPLGAKIVYSKAKNVNDFKQKHNIVKCRETNDLHHARDAYLNVVVGNVLDTKFTSNRAYFYSDKEGVQRGYNLDKLFSWKVEGARNGSSDIDRVKKIVAKTSMSVTRYAYLNKGAFYEETVQSKEDKAIVVPRKLCAPYNQTEKYGGYKSLKTAYFAIVQSKDKKGNLIKTIEAIPILIDYRAREDKNAILKYLQSIGLVNPQILVEKIKVKALVLINGYKAWLAGVTGSQILVHNALQWFTDAKTDEYVKSLAKLLEKDRLGKLSNFEKQQEEIALTSNRKGVTLSTTKTKNSLLYNEILKTLSKTTYRGLSAVESFLSKLQNKEPFFNALTTFEQIKVLLQIIRFMKCNSECPDLTLLQDGATCGKLLISKNITNVDFRIIHQSPCGLTERVQKI